jgi:hypothetical protein
MRAAALAWVLSLTVADKGGIPLAKVDVTEPYQSALIAFNGRTEVLYISSILRPAAKTKLIEVLPLPSEPKAEAADARVIERAAAVYNRKVDAIREERERRKFWQNFWITTIFSALLLPFLFMLIRAIYRREIGPAFAWGILILLVIVVFVPGMLANTASAGGHEPTSQVRILSQQQVGPHGLTVVKANGTGDISRFIEEVIEREKGDKTAFDQGYRNLLEEYANGGYPYFVVDVIEGDPESGPVAPIRYTFASDRVFFPLRISSRGKGLTAGVLLILSTADNISHPPFYSRVWSDGFEMAPAEISEIDPELSKFIGPNKARLRAVDFLMPTEELKTDLVLKVGG